MAGIYIHIPFCRQACHYCDFHFSTRLNLKEEMITEIGNEIDMRARYLAEPVETIYFGGGTPSLLDKIELESLLSHVYENFEVIENPEITLEANPEDLDLEKCIHFLAAGINRLSIGIQTFSTEHLIWMNRVHNIDQSYLAVKNARKAGFQNLSLDLIYALPEHGIKAWKEDLQQAVDLNPEHISLYGLTIESKTVFGHRLKKGELNEVEEEEAAQQYLQAIDFLKNRDYLQYEVSNFGKPEMHSRHNHSYWNGAPYLGVGPGAHSFNGKSRRFNIQSNPKYLKLIQAGQPYFEEENLSQTQLANEKILTGLRTTMGIDLEYLNLLTNSDFLKENTQSIDLLLKGNMIQVQDGRLSLLPLGFLVADEIALQLFFEE